MSTAGTRYVTQSGESVTAETLLGRGKEGATYRVAESDRLAAKIYHTPASSRTVSKLRAMIAHPPLPARIGAGPPVLAWPESMLYDTQRVVRGFTMPLVEPTWSLDSLFYPERRAQLRTAAGQPIGWHHLHEIGRNLARMVLACHDAGYVIGDLNNKNVRVYHDGQVALIDTDSFQVIEGHGRGRSVLHCEVVFPDYVPPELIGRDLHTTERNPHSDAYVLALLLYRLLQEGMHPFSAATDDDPPLDPVQLVSRRIFPYTPEARARGVVPYPGAPPFGRLHAGLRDRFLTMFTVGLDDLGLRPTAAEWEAALATARHALVTCTHGHYYAIAGSGRCLQLIPTYGGSFCGSTETVTAPLPLGLRQVDPISGALIPGSAPPRHRKPPATPPPFEPPPYDQSGWQAFVQFFWVVAHSMVSNWKWVVPSMLFLLYLVWTDLDEPRPPSTQQLIADARKDPAYLTIVAPRPVPTHRPPIPATIGKPALAMLQSPTGPGVLFVSTRTGDTWSLSAHEVDAIRQVTLLYEAPVDPRPTVSPDRSRLAYFSYFLKSYRVTTISLLDGSIDYFPLPDPDTRPVDLAWMPDAESLLVSVDTVDGMRLDRLNLPQQRRMQSESGGSSDASIGLVDRWNTGIVAADLSLAPSDIVSPNGQYAVYERVHPLTRIHTLSLAPVAGIASPIAIYRGVWPIESVWMSDRALLIGSCGSDACSILQQQIDENAATLLFTLEAERIGRVAFLPAMDEGS